jgi:hypothetical protein
MQPCLQPDVDLVDHIFDFMVRDMSKFALQSVQQTIKHRVADGVLLESKC